MEESDKEIIGMLITFAVIMSGVQWLFVRFTHWSVAFIVTAVVTCIVAFLYVTLSQATPNGGSNGPDMADFMMPMVVISGTLLGTLWLVCYLTEAHTPKVLFIVPLCLMLVFAIGRNVYEYVAGATFYFTNFSTCNIKIMNETGSKSNIDVITFRSSSSGFSTDIRPASKEEPYPQMIRFADTITFYCSTENNQEIQKDFPFDYSLFKEEKGSMVGYCFWLTSHKALPLKLVLLPHNNVDLYIDNRFIQKYQLGN